MDIKNLDSQVIVSTYARFPLVLKSGKGSIAYDENNKEYIDLGSGIAVNSFGFADEIWQNAVNKQSAKIQHTSNLYYTEPCTLLASKLCEKTGMKKVFFGNSGAEANECAIKAARKYSFDRYGEGRHTIITMKNSFHGRTITTLSATGQDSYHTLFTPFTDGFVYAEENIEDVIRLSEDNNCCAIMFEVIQGEGGVNLLDKSFIKAMADLAKEKDLLLIIDEVQTGNGRTGKYFSYMHFGINPDIVATAKGLGGGLPIGATLFNEKCAEILTPGTHGSTFGGNPVCCAGALSIIERIDSALMAEVEEKSKMVIEILESTRGIKNISGMGLMLGFECEKDTKQVIDECRQKGVLIISAKNKIRLLPALNIPAETLKKAILILKEVVEQ